MLKTTVTAVLGLLFILPLQGQRADKFKQLYEEWSTPNVYRNGSGAPGHRYFQQQADYDIEVEVDDENQRIFGNETITYHNNSPDALTYFWLQLDQNIRKPDSDSKKISQNTIKPNMSYDELKRMLNSFEGGYNIDFVTDIDNKPLPYTVVKTMMRVDLPKPLKPGEKYQLKLKWWFNVQNRAEFGGRMGYEYFEKDSNYLYCISKFFPRMCVYNDIDGWQNKQFLGSGEFTLPFGNYKVKVTVPKGHVVAATGVLQNANQVLSNEQRNRLELAKKSSKPVFIINEAEAKKAESARPTGKSTWIFYAENVRDFAFANSRKFIWDAQGVQFGNRTVLAMSFYPKEGNPLWEKYSTKVVVQTLKTYSKYTFDYPYPVAISVHTNNIGMEYPMICFNGGRPEADGTYSEGTKYGMIGVIIHEVGHNYFPMIVNSDERQWTWMDEGLNTFLQYLTEQEWDKNYPSRRGPAYKIVDYMKSDPRTLEPIMTNSESLVQFGNNAYGKVCTGLNILRETILGRELFDYAFKTYSQRWMFKHPSPEDFFRTMEDASGIDLDWFWRGWFYGIDYCDQNLLKVTHYNVNTKNPEIEKPIAQEIFEKDDKQFIGNIRNRTDSKPSVVEIDAETKDFYNQNQFEVKSIDLKEYQALLNTLNEEEKNLLNNKLHFYELKIENLGELVMPVILSFTFADSSVQKEYIPAEIWRFDDKVVSKVFWFEKEVIAIALDPNLEIPDADRNNNYWPQRVVPGRFELFKQQRQRSENPMQREIRLNQDR